MTSMSVETLEGRRLRLSPLFPADAEILHEAVEASRLVLKRRVRWIGAVQGAEDERAFIERSAAAAERGEAFVWGLYDSRTGRLAGVCSLDRMNEPERARARWGVWVRPDKQDKGCAFEAGRLVAEHAFRKLGLYRLYARLDPTNRAFRKVLKKLGFRYEGCMRGDKRLNGRWIDQECWGLLRTEWKK